jgi:hypothetical protein
MPATMGRSVWPAYRFLTVAGLLGTAALLLPFTFDLTPVDALRDWGAWDLALPAYLAPFIFLGSIGATASGGPRRLMQGIGYLLAAGTLVCVIASYAELNNWPQEPIEWIAMLAPVTILGFGGTSLRRVLRSGRPAGDYSGVVAMQVAYVANGVLALGGFFGHWQAGAYAVLCTTLIYAVQIALVRKATAPGPDGV